MATRVFSSAELGQQIAGMQATLGSMQHILKNCQQLEASYRAQGRYESDLAADVKARYAEVRDLASQVVTELGGSDAAMSSDFYDALGTFQLIVKPGRPVDWESASVVATTDPGTGYIGGNGTKAVWAGFAEDDVVFIDDPDDVNSVGMTSLHSSTTSTALHTVDDLLVDAENLEIAVTLIQDDTV